MKKLFVIFFALCTVSFSQTVQKMSFKNLIVGESTKKDFIKMFPNYFAIESDEGEENELYGVKSKIKEIDILIGAGFIDNILENIGFVTLHDRVNPYNFIIDYNDIQNELIKKYGKYDSFEPEWLNKLYYDNELDYGKAAIYGHLILRTEWLLLNGSVKLILKGENYKAEILLFQASDKYIENVQKQAEKPSF